MSKIKIYTAGAMEAHGGTDYAKQWRTEVNEYFERYCDNVEVINPTDFYEYGANKHRTHKEIFDFDLHKVRKSDVILVDLNNIRKSIGTCMELKEASTYNIPVIGFLDDELSVEEMVQLIHPWVYCCCNRIETGERALNNTVDYIRNYYC